MSLILNFLKNGGYQNRLVAFIDLLGWTNAVIESAENQGANFEILDDNNAQVTFKSNKTLGILSFLDLWKPFIKKHQQYNKDTPNADFHFTLFSDCIVLSEQISNNDIDLVHRVQFLLSHIETICVTAVTSGFLVRGGIAIGPLVHTNSFCFGPAMIEAYKLESEEAIFPRIIMQKEVAEWLRKNVNYDYNDGRDYKTIVSEIKNLDKELSKIKWRPRKLYQCDDGWVAYNYLHNLGMSVLDGMSERLRQSFSNQKYELPVVEKINWFIDFFNKVASYEASSGHTNISHVKPIK